MLSLGGDANPNAAALWNAHFNINLIITIYDLFLAEPDGLPAHSRVNSQNFCLI